LMSLRVELLLEDFGHCQYLGQARSHLSLYPHYSCAPQDKLPSGRGHRKSGAIVRTRDLPLFSEFLLLPVLMATPSRTDGTAWLEEPLRSSPFVPGCILIRSGSSDVDLRTGGGSSTSTWKIVPLPGVMRDPV
jgi:hypothetical protein